MVFFTFGIGSNLLLAYGHLKGAERFHRNLTLDDALRNSIAQTLSTGLQAITSILMACILSPYLIPVIVVVMVFFLLIQNVYVSSIRQMKRLESVSKSPLISHLSETIGGSDTIRAYGVSAQYEQSNQRNVDNNHVTMFAITMSNRWLATLLESMCNVLILIVSVFAVCVSQRSAGTTGLVVSQMMALTQYLNWVVRMAGELESNIVCVERIEEYSRLPSEAPWQVAALKPASNWPKGEIAFIKYATKYRENFPPVLRNLSFRVQVGQKIGLVGRTGSGKSSLVNALFRLLEATEGQILIDDVDISKLGLHDLRGGLTIIPQDPVLFSSTLRFNLDPFELYSDKDVWQALQMANLKSHIEQNDYGKGLNMPIDEGGGNLSLGQRQLVCLARALLRRSQILVLDEATSSVDPMTDHLIQETIRREFKGSTVITIAHRINTVMDYDKILVMDNGSILEFESPSALLQNPNSQFFSLAKEAGVAGIGEAYDPSKLSSPQQLVEGCHLKCLNSKEGIDSVCATATARGWNQTLIGFHSTLSNSGSDLNPINCVIAEASHAQAFNRSWNMISQRSDPDSRSRLHLLLLLCQTPELISQLFTTGQAVQIFAQLLDALLTTDFESTQEVEGALQILSSIADSGQADICVFCMPESAYQRLETFFERLKQFCPPGSVENIQLKFKRE
ncbi:hypothetical protein Ciccas_003231 [Cichlidogyrus casuarinus]|uniref:Uncharacterized protein n=1 Tax=Cichlidogyrus casuarinus TaxID=1844966 RepID=A0ABD2QEY7_9PLAT